MQSVIQKLSFLILVVLLAACASGPGRNSGRVVIDSSAPDKPSWAQTTKVSWEEGDRVLIKGSHTIRGDERVTGCYTLAKLELKEQLLGEINSDLRGETNLASEGISESTGPNINKMLQEMVEGGIRGLRFREQLYERYVVNETERIDCQVLAEMRQRDYQDLRNRIANKLAESDPEMKAMLRGRMKKFFKSEEPAAEPKPEAKTEPKTVTTVHADPKATIEAGGAQ